MGDATGVPGPSSARLFDAPAASYGPAAETVVDPDSAPDRHAWCQTGAARDSAEAGHDLAHEQLDRAPDLLVRKTAEAHPAENLAHADLPHARDVARLLERARAGARDVDLARDAPAAEQRGDLGVTGQPRSAALPIPSLLTQTW